MIVIIHVNVIEGLLLEGERGALGGIIETEAAQSTIVSCSGYAPQRPTVRAGVPLQTRRRDGQGA